MPEPWRKLSSATAGDFKIFKLRLDRLLSPRTGVEHDFVVIDCVNWVNVVAETTAGELVFIHQYRHGSNTVELEIPGGMIDPGDASPEAAAIRELREETGFVGEHARVIADVFPNPAIMSNRCFTVLVENCRCTEKVQFDHSEDLATVLLPPSEIAGLVQQGKIRHALVLVGLYHYELLRLRRGTSPPFSKDPLQH